MTTQEINQIADLLDERITQKLVRHLDAQAEDFQARERRLIEAFDGNLATQLQPIEEKLDTNSLHLQVAIAAMLELRAS